MSNGNNELQEDGTMAVLQVVRSINPVGGINGVAFCLAREFHKRGLIVETLTGELPKEQFVRVPLGKLSLLSGVKCLINLSHYLRFELAAIWFSFLATWKLKARYRDSVILSHGDSLSGDIFVGHACHWASTHIKIRNGRWRWVLNPVNWFVIVRDLWVFRGKRFRRLIAISRSISEEFQQYHNVPSDRIRVIPNGVDITRFTPELRPWARKSVFAELGFPEESFLLLFVGHEFRRKGLAPLIRALPKVEAGNNKIVLVALGRDNPTPYRRLAEECGVLDKVCFMGTRPDVETYMAAADLFVFPTDYEPFGLVGLEAMASGTPVLAPGIDGIVEYLKDGVNGLFIKREPEDIAEKISSLLGDAERRRAMGKEARKTAERFSWEQISAKYLEVINEVAREKKAGKEAG